jgi:hypothetical protein
MIMAALLMWNQFPLQTDVNQAISMVSYFASSSEPAQIRGKTVYIQYSNRQEIINNKSPGETAGNVLLVTIEGVQSSDVTIDVIHMVSSKILSFSCLLKYLDGCVSMVMTNLKYACYFLDCR